MLHQASGSKDVENMKVTVETIESSYLKNEQKYLEKNLSYIRRGVE